jgi:5-methylcytosine-specific restriction endonuclease McrA
MGVLGTWLRDLSASVCDHIIPVSPEMPDSLFLDPANLRASCKRHNTARGVAARLERELSGVDERPRRNPLVVRWR